MTDIGVGVIGLGFMGRTHIAAYTAAAEAGHACTLVAVCDQDAARLSGTVEASGNFDTGGEAEQIFDPAVAKGTTDPAELFADPAVQLVSICTHTDTHVDLALEALEAGKHVLVEKPLALTSVEARRVADAARAAQTICMPAMCMRFWPAWAWLKRAIESGEYGAVRSATFHRLGSTPGWTDFYTDDSRSGGALVDLHIHDADFIAWCFGTPQSVTSAGGTNHLTTLFRYADVPHVVAEGGWAQDPGFGFKMRFVVCFESATADFDLGREQQLLLCREGESEAVEVDSISGYDGQIRHLLGCIASGRTRADVTPDDAVLALQILEAERASLETGNPVRL
jgi:predicted dehydrogenase